VPSVLISVVHSYSFGSPHLLQAAIHLSLKVKGQRSQRLYTASYRETRTVAVYNS